MRQKSIQKRELILEAASKLFLANGFEKTSMADINSLVGGSKATLYSHFASKDELFVECIYNLAEQYLEQLFSSLHDETLEIRAALLRFGIHMIQLLSSPELIAAKRLLIAEANRSEVGKLFSDKIGVHQKAVAKFIQRSMAAGKLIQGDPDLVAIQLRALLEAEIIEPCLLCTQTLPLTEATIQRAAENAITTFMRAFSAESLSD